MTPGFPGLEKFKMKIEIGADTAEELKKKILELAQLFVPAQVSAQALVEAKAEEALAISEPVKRKPGRPRKVAADTGEAPAEALASKQDPIPTPIAPAILKEDAIKALEKVHAAQGLPAARLVLGEFGARKISEVPLDRYGAFISRCQEKVAEGEISS